MPARPWLAVATSATLAVLLSALPAAATTLDPAPPAGDPAPPADQAPARCAVQRWQDRRGPSLEDAPGSHAAPG